MRAEAIPWSNNICMKAMNTDTSTSRPNACGACKRDMTIKTKNENACIHQFYDADQNNPQTIFSRKVSTRMIIPPLNKIRNYRKGATKEFLVKYKSIPYHLWIQAMRWSAIHMFARLLRCLSYQLKRKSGMINFYLVRICVLWNSQTPMPKYSAERNVRAASS